MLFFCLSSPASRFDEGTVGDGSGTHTIDEKYCFVDDVVVDVVVVVDDIAVDDVVVDDAKFSPPSPSMSSFFSIEVVEVPVSFCAGEKRPPGKSLMAGELGVMARLDTRLFIMLVPGVMPGVWMPLIFRFVGV